MVVSVRRNWRSLAGLCCLSLGLLLLCWGPYKAFGRVASARIEDQPTVEFSASSYTIGKGQTAEIVVTLNRASHEDVTISYAISDGTAGTLTIPAGARSGKLAISTNKGGGSQLRTFNVSLSSPSNAKLGSSSAKVYVVNSPNGQACT